MNNTRKTKKQLIEELKALRSKTDGAVDTGTLDNDNGDEQQTGGLSRRELLSGWVAPVILTVPLTTRTASAQQVDGGVEFVAFPTALSIDIQNAVVPTTIAFDTNLAKNEPDAEGIVPPVTFPPFGIPPTNHPTASPTEGPTASPTRSQTFHPTKRPTASPTGSPTLWPTGSPTLKPTASPTGSPTLWPTGSPTMKPTRSPTLSPTASPTLSPVPTASPTLWPTGSPTMKPTRSPTLSPTASPTLSPVPTASPTVSPTTAVPTASPTVVRPNKIFGDSFEDVE